MNREQKRLLQRQGQLGPDGEPVSRKREQTRPSATAAAQAQRGRAKPREFLHEVNVELRKVAWPSRAETVNYSSVVFITLAVIITLIFFLDILFADTSKFIFK